MKSDLNNTTESSNIDSKIGKFRFDSIDMFCILNSNKVMMSCQVMKRVCEFIDMGENGINISTLHGLQGQN